MRYRSPHAAEGGRAPLALRGPGLARTVGMTVVAGAIGLVPTLIGFTPAHANVPGTRLTISDATVLEGGDLSFAWRYTGPGSESYTLAEGAPTGVNGTNAAVAGTDYTALTGPAATLAPSAGNVTAQTGTIVIHTANIPLYEGTRTFTLTATGTGDAASAVGTITEISPAPTYTLSATPNPVNEANTSVTLTATLSTASGVATTIGLTTTDGSAKAGTNYAAGPYTSITIAAGQFQGTRTIGILDDGMHDATSPMTFTVNATGTNVAGANQNTQVSINDAQPMPKLTLAGDATVAEGAGAVAAYHVNADYASATPITVTWSAIDTTPATGHAAATPGADFTYPSTGRTVTIPAGATTAPLNIPITSDGLNELPEDYTIALSDPANATLGAVSKVVTTITSTDAAPTVSVAPAAVTEGDSGKRTQTFTATLSAPSGRAVTVDWNTADSSALQGYDYVATSGELVFAPGTTSKTFTVDIIGDKVYEAGNETFSIQLAAPASEMPASLNISAPAVVTILDDDPQPTISVGDISVKEGDITTPVLVPVKLSNPTSVAVTYTLTDVPQGTTSNDPNSIAPGANDYNLLSRTLGLTIPAGQVNGYGVILLNGDTMYEPDEVTNLNWSATGVASPTTGTAKVTILNDDKAPNFEVNSIKGHEGDTVDVSGTVTGWSQDPTVLTLSFTPTSVNGKAGASADDFVNPGGKSVTIAPGTASGVVLPIASVMLNKDSKDEPDETILVSGVGTNNVGTVTDGVITILGSKGDNNPPPPSGNAPTIMAPSWVTGAVAVPITGKADPGATVDLWAGAWNSDMPKLMKIDSTTAGKDGSFSFSRWIGSGYRFQVASGGETSDVVKVGINQAPVFVASSTSAGKLSLAVQGNPRGGKQSVVVQAWVGGKWVNTWKGMTGSDNLWKATVSQKSKSSWTLRAFVQGDTSMGVNGGYSAAKKVTIK